MADIIDLFNGDVEKDTDPDATLLLLMGRLDGFVLSGVDKEGREVTKEGREVTAVTFGTLPQALWFFERGKKTILERVDNEE
jgi:hypothetical protein